MNNLEKFDSQELTIDEMKSINGGFVCGGLCVFGIVAGAGLVGVGVGYALAWALD
ncbi:MAG TPA: class IIb bacteriocin, lactobin A/cerein 7B family [Cytophagales bacterium]|nr:class IIb bacteriocin, lactobin A/cerein 7B family [Cytophagales bacterium]